MSKVTLKSRGEIDRYCPDHMTFMRKPNSSATWPPRPRGLVLGERKGVGEGGRVTTSLMYAYHLVLGERRVTTGPVQ